MGDKRTFVLVHEQARKNAAAYAMTAPDNQVVTFKDQIRSLDQNAKFHAICGELEKSNKKWGGKQRSLDDWKVIFVSGHAKATNRECDVVEGIEGEVINLRESTAKMSKARSASLLEYTLAFCAINEIQLKDR